MMRIAIALAASMLVIAGCGGGTTTDTTNPLLGDSVTTTVGATHTTMAHDDDMHGDDSMTGHSMSDAAGEGDSFPTASSEPTSEYEIHMSEFAFAPASLSLVPGETVRFTLVNEGAVPHELRLTTHHRAEEHIAAGHEDHGDESGHHESMDIVILVGAGETRVVELTLPDDADLFDLLACLIPGHFEAGMRGDVSFG